MEAVVLSVVDVVVFPVVCELLLFDPEVLIDSLVLVVLGVLSSVLALYLSQAVAETIIVPAIRKFNSEEFFILIDFG